MASVCPPKPSYVPLLPEGLIEAGLLSDAQLETVIYAGEAHHGQLAGAWTVDATFDQISAAPENADGMVRFRRGFMLGDGTGAGKGRQVAGVLLDNWLKGRRRALWVSKSDALIEDAQRDWSALGQERLLVTPLSRFRQGAPIRLEEGILFTTYATLRSDEREGKVSRVRQIVDWLGSDFDGVIVFDESHAMQNAAGGKGERGEQAASQQGKAGLRLQHALPDARILYVSATGATTVHNLAYAQRLGLWGGEDFPFANRAEFVQAIEAGGVAAMEVLARDLKALGLYAARSLSYEGVEYEIVEHRLTEASDLRSAASSRSWARRALGASPAPSLPASLNPLIPPPSPQRQGSTTHAALCAAVDCACAVSGSKALTAMRTRGASGLFPRSRCRLSGSPRCRFGPSPEEMAMPAMCWMPFAQERLSISVPCRSSTSPAFWPFG